MTIAANIELVGGSTVRRILQKPLVLVSALALLVGACAESQDLDDGLGAPQVSSTANPTTAPTTTAPTTAESTATDGGAIGSSQDVAAGEGSCPVHDPGPSQIMVEVATASYPVQVFVPSSYGQQALPVVLNWHGLGSTGSEQAFLSDYESLAEREGFIVAHPTGLSSADSGDARGWELVQFDVAERDDVAMANALIDQLVKSFCGDAQRVYSTGMSNGGFFTARLVCELSDRLAAAVSVAGVSHPDSCEPQRPVPYMAFHGTADGVVPFSGGESTLASPESPPQLQAFFDQVMPDEFAEFAADAGCGPDPTASELSDEVIRHDYGGCDDDVPLTFFEVVDGGHTWPGSPLGPLMEGFVGKTTNDISATNDGWDFMQQFSLSD